MGTVDANMLQIHMGKSFAGLSPRVQSVHLGKTRIEGVVNVEHGGWLARIICNVFRFPREGKKVKLRVDSNHTPESITWNRNFGGHRMNSSFYRKGEELIERLGPLELHFQAKEQAGALVYHFGKTALFGQILPALLSPQVQAKEFEASGVYQFEVTVRMRLVGLVISYGGAMTLVPVCPSESS